MRRKMKNLGWWVEKSVHECEGRGEFIYREMVIFSYLTIPIDFYKKNCKKLFFFQEDKPVASGDVIILTSWVDHIFKE